MLNLGDRENDPSPSNSGYQGNNTLWRMFSLLIRLTPSPQMSELNSQIGRNASRGRTSLADDLMFQDELFFAGFRCL